MAKYKVSADTSWRYNAFTEIVVEAKTAPMAKYKASKIICNDFRWFLKYCYPTVEKVSNDTPLTIKKWIDLIAKDPLILDYGEKIIGSTVFCLISEKMWRG